jgi:uncharacterized protein YndB with AHSA1/START domain
MTPGLVEMPVRKTIVVQASARDAFEVFTDDIDSWWPRTHHIGKSPMRRVIVEGRRGGRCYTQQEDGSEADWGRVLEWSPPDKLLLAWQITHEWGYQPDLARASEVEVRFIPVGAGTTRVELEHRHFERHGAGGEAMRAAVDAPNGWTLITTLYQARVTSRLGGPT